MWRRSIRRATSTPSGSRRKGDVFSEDSGSCVVATSSESHSKISTPGMVSRNSRMPMQMPWPMRESTVM